MKREIIEAVLFGVVWGAAASSLIRLYFKRVFKLLRCEGCGSTRRTTELWVVRPRDDTRQLRTVCAACIELGRPYRYEDILQTWRFDDARGRTPYGI